jgi:hypothetical protein
MADTGHPPGMKITPTPLFQRGVLKSPFNKGGFRGILIFTLSPRLPKIFIQARRLGFLKNTSKKQKTPTPKN